MTSDLPAGVQWVRTTPEFDQDTVPAGLLSAHRLAAGVWARVVVRSGSLAFVFDDDPERPHRLSAGDCGVVPPERPHHLVLDGPVRLVLDFYR